MTRFFQKNRRLKRTAIALRRTALILTGITAVTLAVSTWSTPPVEAGPALVGQDLSNTKTMTKSTSATRSAVTKGNFTSTPKGKLIIASAAISPPEAGVQLLIGILQRIGTEPQIAQKTKQDKIQQADIIASNAMSNQMQLPFQSQAADPSLMIRPQQQLKKSSAKMIPPPPPELTKALNKIAMLPKEQVSYDRVQQASEEKEASGAKSYSAGYGANSTNVRGTLMNQLGASGANENFDQRFGRLQRSINKMYGAADRFSESSLERNRTAAEPMPAAERKVMQISGERRGTVISASPKITVYGDESAGTTPGAAAGFSMRTKADADAGRMNRQETDSESASKDVTEMKPEQPAKYKYMREWSQPGADQAEIVDNRPIIRDYRSANSPVADKAKTRSLAGANMPLRIASAPFIPPSLVAGIPGLRLGATESQVNAFVKGRGTLTQKSFNGWKILSLSNSGSSKTALQIYMRNGIVEAFRIFDDAYVPDRQMLGVSLTDEISKMKEKFGEPQFILKEPGNSKNARGAKNYVYPPNQVSFQLARTEASGSPKIQSMLLFQFL